ncbi:hypothetical protein FRB90_012531 [Tulasnella sp. 427]|nr:hypothetical protein FRB90_012531 [Tulasnella sp. 427]
MASPTQELLEDVLDSRVNSKPDDCSAPIHKTPPEILAVIFKLLMPPEWEPQYDTRRTIAGVCQHWRAVLKGTPTLWSAICCVEDRKIISNALRNSGVVGLEFGLRAWDGRNRPFFYQKRADILTRHWRSWNLVLKHRSRWRSVNLQLIQVPPVDITTKLLGPGPPPGLREFSIQVFEAGRPPANALELIRGPLPNLRRLALQIVSIEWSEFFAPQLINLRLTDIRRFGPTLLQLFDILVACPSLERVVIKAVSSLHDIPTPQSLQNRPLPARLDRLRKIHLSNITPQSTKWLLEAIEIPSECSVILKSEVDRNPELTLLPSNVRDLPARCLSGASKILITIREPLIRFRSDGLWSLHLRFTSAVFVRDLLLWLGVDEEWTTIDSCGPVPLIELKCDKFTREMPDDFYEPLSGLQSIRRIAGASRYAWSLPRFQVLGARNVNVASESDGGSPSAISFPGLEEISVSFKGYGPSTFDFLSKMITDRRRLHEEAGTVDRLRAIKFEDPRANSRAADQADVTTAPLKLLAFINLLKGVLAEPPKSMMASAKTKLSENVLDNQINAEAIRDPTTIYHLPPEILGIIFNYRMPPAWEAQSKPRKTISSVCQHWHAVVEKTPMLWSAICCTEGMDSILEALIKSGERRLDFGSRAKDVYTAHVENPIDRRAATGSLLYSIVAAGGSSISSSESYRGRTESRPTY